MICGLSGGVDSSVVAALLYKAIGPQLSCILIDNGLLRKDEQSMVIREFSEHFKTDLHVVHAEGRFLSFQQGMQSFAENPLFGAGLGSFRARTGVATHNLYHEALGELGIMGLAVLLAFAWSYFANFFEARRLRGDS